MRKSLLFKVLLVALIISVGCCKRHDGDTSALLSADEAFSRMSVEKGMNAAFIFFAADSMIKMRDGKFPLTTKAEMSAEFLRHPDSGMVLKWAPLKAEAAMSDDMGYTFGNWELYLESADTTLYGNYVSVWKKQSDGTWKYILDAGCNTPKPSEIQHKP
ncbi:MAG: hypothetical protein ACOYNC_09930 [Bacteroidales bacterium]